MNLYTFLTPSHRVLYENYFLKSLPSTFILSCLDIEHQYCESASFLDKGWTQTTINKIILLIKACEENMGKYFVYSDVDVQFFDKDICNLLMQEIEDKDIACQDDNNLYCSGFFICKANDRTLKMYNKIYESWNHKDSDQKMLNRYLYLCKPKKLSKKFFTVGQILKKEWTDDQHFDLISDISMHHANWTIGIDNKIKLLDLVKLKRDSIAVGEQ
jgi:hypothetical protein